MLLRYAGNRKNVCVGKIRKDGRKMCSVHTEYPLDDIMDVLEKAPTYLNSETSLQCQVSKQIIKIPD